MLIMYLMHRRNKNKGAEVWVQKDVGAVDLTPWKYSKIVSVIVIVCVRSRPKSGRQSGRQTCT